MTKTFDRQEIRTVRQAVFHNSLTNRINGTPDRLADVRPVHDRIMDALEAAHLYEFYMIHAVDSIRPGRIAARRNRHAFQDWKTYLEHLNT